MKVDPINEVKLMNSLDHPNIIKCCGYFEHKEKLCILLEYADEGKISAFLRILLILGDLMKFIKEAKKSNTSISEKNVIKFKILKKKKIFRFYFGSVKSASR